MKFRSIGVSLSASLLLVASAAHAETLNVLDVTSDAFPGAVSYVGVNTDDQGDLASVFYTKTETC